MFHSYNSYSNFYCNATETCEQFSWELHKIVCHKNEPIVCFVPEVDTSCTHIRIAYVIMSYR